MPDSGNAKGPPRLTAVPLSQNSQNADGRNLLQPAPLSAVGYNYNQPRPDYPHRPAPTPAGNGNGAHAANKQPTQPHSQQAASPAGYVSQQQQYGLPLHEVARAALASLPPLPTPNAQRLPPPARGSGYMPGSPDGV